jgi:acyl carrier protein
MSHTDFTNGSDLITADRRAEIKTLICDILELDEHEVTESSLFKEDHGADSLRAIEILAELERAFDVEIHQDDLVRMVNLDGVHAVLSEAFVA